jgi:hypothetical protein
MDYQHLTGLEGESLQSIEADIEVLEADVSLLQTSKQPAIIKGAAAGTIQILDSNNFLRPIWGAGNVVVLDQGHKVMIGVNSDSSKQDNLTVSAPLSLNADNLSIDMSSKQDTLTVAAPLEIAGDVISVNEAGFGHIQCTHLTASADITCAALYGGVINQLNAQFVSSEQLYSREPAFNTSQDLVKTLNIPQASMVLGLSNTFLNRIAAAELSPFHCAGAVDASNGTPVILTSKGRYGFTVTNGAVGVYDINFNTNHPDAAFVIQISSQQNDHFIRMHNNVSMGFVNTGFRCYLTTRSNVAIDVPFCFSVIA